MYSHFADVLDTAEATHDADAMFAAMRVLPLEDFVHAVFYPEQNRIALRDRLPQLPDAQVQRNWVGEDGPRLEQMTAAFVRNLDLLLKRRYGGQIPPSFNVLDYGCGWGRILRMMPYFTSLERIHGVDPVQDSLDHCVAGRVPGHLAICDSIPTVLPFTDRRFDLIYAFSVFTHLSERTARAVLTAARRGVAENGLFVITVRPIEFWPLVEPAFGPARIAQMETVHRSGHYAFTPVSHLTVNGEATYGDTSIPLPLLAAMVEEHGWRMDPGYLRSLVDPFQIIIALYPS